ncbi:MAG: hypothetical protein ACKVH0_12340, partial [Alphaproteobacteria bacterium]
VIGFAGTRRHRLTRHVSCRVHKAGPNAFLHGCPAGKGHSGGPLFAWRGERRVALGLHVAVSRTQGYAVQAKSIREDAARRPY